MAMILIVPLTFSASAQSGTVELTLTFTNLADPGNDHYEGWLIMDGQAISTGKFSLDSSGNLVDLEGNIITTFTVENIDLDMTTKFVLTLEPSGDTDEIPAFVKPLAGDLKDGIATLSPNLGVELTGIAGKYILATPSNGADTNELSGIWWLTLESGMPDVGLTLPNLNETDWIYEGWVVIDGTPVSTGKFNESSGFDDFSGYSSTQGFPPFPGEDFLLNAPTQLTFPKNLTGQTAVISIEPRVDNSPDPFQFKILSHTIPTDAEDHVTYTANDISSSLASGMATIKSKVTTSPFIGLFELSLVLLTIPVIGMLRRKD
jgi:hypothetical protein